MNRDTQEVLVVCWEWVEPQKYAGSRFWGCHSLESDGRLRDWPTKGMRPIGAARAMVTVGEGLDLIPSAAALKAGGEA